MEEQPAGAFRAAGEAVIAQNQGQDSLSQLLDSARGHERDCIRESGAQDLAQSGVTPSAQSQGLDSKLKDPKSKQADIHVIATDRIIMPDQALIPTTLLEPGSIDRLKEGPALAWRSGSQDGAHSQALRSSTTIEIDSMPQPASAHLAAPMRRRAVIGLDRRKARTAQADILGQADLDDLGMFQRPAVGGETVGGTDGWGSVKGMGSESRTEQLRKNGFAGVHLAMIPMRWQFSDGI